MESRFEKGIAMEGKSRLANPERRLPELTLPALSGGAALPLRAPGRASRVLLLLHGAGCARCAAYLDGLALRERELAAWDGHVLAVVPAPPSGASRSGGGGVGGPDHPSVPVALDPHGRLASALPVGAPAVLVADQWGEIHLAHGAGEAHAFPAPEEVVESVRYLAIQCPECQGEAL
jgi:hypothetical protein